MVLKLFFDISTSFRFSDFQRSVWSVQSIPEACPCSNARGCSLPKLFLQISENTIIDLPTGVVTIHMDQTEPRIPAIAVASGTQIYIYKNLKPYFKFQLPSLEVHPVEKELWAGE